MIATIGYEKSTPEDFVATLEARNIEVLVDIRDRPQSRRPGFSKTALSTAVNQAGIDYIHVKALGDPKEGRDAARAGKMNKFRAIFENVLAGTSAQSALADLEQLARSKRICLMCYERDHHACHRKIVSDHLENSLGLKTIHLGVVENGRRRLEKRRMLHSCEGATSQVEQVF